MKLCKFVLPVLILLFLIVCSQDQMYQPSAANLEMRKWFQDAKFGMFIHWGIYSVLGDGEWVMHNKKMSIADYEKLPLQFNPTEYNPTEWVRLAKQAGMKYITITSKHHDGFAMYDSKVSDWDIVDRTPYKKDVLKMLADECKTQGLKLFFYYSHLDWHHPDYFPPGRTGQYGGRLENGQFDKYLTYMNEQIKELCSGRYGEIGGIWFDGWWDQQLKRPGEPVTATQIDWRLRQTYDLIHKLQPRALVGNNHHVAPFPGEDFQMFEKDLPGRNTAGFNEDAVIGNLPLETCETINNSWGYNKNDLSMKSTRELIQYLVKAAGNNANFLLNVGPMPQGNIQPEFVTRLTEIGGWMDSYGEAVYGTRGGPFDATDQYTTTYRDNRIYVHILNWNGRENLGLPSVIDQTIKKAWILGEPANADYSFGLVRQHPWGMYINVPKERQNETDTIVVLEMEEPASTLVQPRISDQDPGQAILLSCDAAKISDGLEYKSGPDWIQGWKNVNQTMSWRIKLAAADNFDLTMTYASMPGSEGSEFEIVSGKNKVAGVVEKTNGWAGEEQNFEEKHLQSKLHLSAGVNTITLRFTRKSETADELIRLYSLKLISPAAKEAIAAAAERARTLRANTDWFVAAKYGIMFHWTPSVQPRRGPLKPFCEAVRDFNVEGFADMVQETGAGYVIFTSVHGIQWYPGPMQTIETILPNRTCERDLMGDMADALAKREIKFIMYYHHGVGDYDWEKASGFLQKDKSRFFKNEKEILTEIGLRYGKKVAGFWFDDRYPRQPFEELYQATKVGNPDRIVAYNSWILPKSTEFQDYYAGEFAGALVVPEASYFAEGGGAAGLQPHGLIFIDDPWAHGRPDTDIVPPLFSNQELIDYVKTCIDKKLVITLNMSIYQDGMVSPATLEQMRALRQAIRGS